jgi:hypothetical protein
VSSLEPIALTPEGLTLCRLCSEPKGGDEGVVPVHQARLDKRNGKRRQTKPAEWQFQTPGCTPRLSDSAAPINYLMEDSTAGPADSL